jgi:hypothetical protein
VRPNADNPRAFACIAAMLTRLAKEVNAFTGPIHPAGAVRESTRSANGRFETIKYQIEPD